VSNWIQCGSNPPAAGDFTVNAAPGTPTALGQFQSDGTTAISTGGTTTESTVVFKGTVSDVNGDTVKMQLELRPVGTAFTNSFTHQSAFLASGSIASITATGVSLNDYHWQGRSVDSIGATSAWTSFGGNAESAADFTVTSPPNTPPAAPTLPGQFQADGITAISVGTTTNQSTVVFKANVTDAESTVRLIIELRTLLPAGWTSAATHTSAFVSSGSQATISVAALADDSYRWRYAAEDANGATSAWTTFGGNPDTSADFVVNTATNNPPSAPTSPGQFTTGDVAIPSGGTTPDSTVVFKANVSDPDGNPVQLEIEVRVTGTPFSNTASASSGLVASGTQASVSLGGLSGSYHWQYRAVDSSGAASAWIAFGTDPDFTASYVPPPPPPPGGGGGGGGGGGCGASPGAGSPYAVLAVWILIMITRRAK